MTLSLTILQALDAKMILSFDYGNTISIYTEPKRPDKLLVKFHGKLRGRVYNTGVLPPIGQLLKPDSE